MLFCFYLHCVLKGYILYSIQQTYFLLKSIWIYEVYFQKHMEQNIQLPKEYVK